MNENIYAYNESIENKTISLDLKLRISRKPLSQDRSKFLLDVFL